MKTVFFLSLWVTNSLFFYLAFLIWPTSVVLGNDIRSPIVAAMLNGFLLTFLTMLVPLVMKIVKIKTKKEGELAFIYFIFNVIGIWVLARLATFTGFGITAFWVALILAAFVNLLQWAIMKTTVKKSN